MLRSAQTVDKKLFSPEGGRIAFSANERIDEFLDFVIQSKLAYVNKPKQRSFETLLLLEQNGLNILDFDKMTGAVAIFPGIALPDLLHKGIHITARRTTNQRIVFFVFHNMRKTDVTFKLFHQAVIADVGNAARYEHVSQIFAAGYSIGAD